MKNQNKKNYQKNVMNAQAGAQVTLNKDLNVTPAGRYLQNE